MGVVLKDTSKPSYEELLAMVQALQAEKAVPANPVAFARSEKNPKFYTFKHGLRTAWPISAPPEVWRVVIANVDMIKVKLPK